MAQEQCEEQVELDIDQDLERTFIEIEFFQRSETRQALKRVLTAFSNYDQTVGYVQGMNFIAAVLFYHAGEVAAFWLLCALVDKHGLKSILQPGMPGLKE